MNNTSVDAYAYLAYMPPQSSHLQVCMKASIAHCIAGIDGSQAAYSQGQGGAVAECEWQAGSCTAQ
jgi:hypothetical protein